MGWCSATTIFDTTIGYVFKLLSQMDLELPSLCEIETWPAKYRKSFIEFAKVIRDELEAGDWDCQGESEYWLILAKYLWPEDWAAYLEWEEQ